MTDKTFKRILIALAFLLGVLLGAAWNEAQTTITPPAQAAAAGFTKLAFDDEFSSLSLAAYDTPAAMNLYVDWVHVFAAQSAVSGVNGVGSQIGGSK